MNMFGVLQSFATEIFNNVIKCMVLSVYDEFVCLPGTEADWENEWKVFIENYDFPCDGVWDGIMSMSLDVLRISSV